MGRSVMALVFFALLGMASAMMPPRPGSGWLAGAASLAHSRGLQRKDLRAETVSTVAPLQRGGAPQQLPGTDDNRMTFVQRANSLTGMLTLKSSGEMSSNPQVDNFINVKLREALRPPSSQELEKFRHTLVQSNPGLTQDQVLGITREDLTKGFILGTLYDELKPVLKPMNVETMSLDVKFAQS